MIVGGIELKLWAQFRSTIPDEAKAESRDAGARSPATSPAEITMTLDARAEASPSSTPSTPSYYEEHGRLRPIEYAHGGPEPEGQAFIQLGGPAVVFGTAILSSDWVQDWVRGVLGLDEPEIHGEPLAY